MRLDHEHHDMSEHRETANAGMQCSRRSRVWRGDIAPFDYAQGRLWQGGANQILFTKCWLFEPTFREQDRSSTMLPQAHRVFTGINLRFERQPRTSCYEHALRGPFRRREILPPGCRRRIGRSSGQTSGLSNHRVISVSGRQVADLHILANLWYYNLRPVCLFHTSSIVLALA